MVRTRRGAIEVALIRPAGRRVWALPKGHMDPGESALEAAEREVREETGLEVALEAPLGDIRYYYEANGERIHKQVSFFLFRWVRGVIGKLAPEMRKEVAEARWVPIEEAHRVLAYVGERELVTKARVLLETEP